MANCCPKEPALTPITVSDCPLNINQILRVWPVRAGEVIWDIVTPANNVPATLLGLAPNDSAGWTILKAAIDDTKVVFPPQFGGDPIVTPGEEITFGGGDNSTRNGATYHVGFTPSEFTARFDSLTGTNEEEISDLTCEGADIEVYLIDWQGNIIGERDGDLFTGFDLATAIVLMGRNIAGFSAPDSNVFKFQLPKEWSFKFEKQAPIAPFKPLTF